MSTAATGRTRPKFACWLLHHRSAGRVERGRCLRIDTAQANVVRRRLEPSTIRVGLPDGRSSFLLGARRHGEKTAAYGSTGERQDHVHQQAAEGGETRRRWRRFSNRYRRARERAGRGRLSRNATGRLRRRDLVIRRGRALAPERRAHPTAIFDRTAARVVPTRASTRSTFHVDTERGKLVPCIRRS